MTRTIITNLISNAIKFSHPNTSIQVGLQNTRRGPQLWIRDSGIGIPPQMLANLGRYGQNIHRTGTNGEEGSGLGLLTAFHLANRTGIQIKASSRPTGRPNRRLSTPPDALRGVLPLHPALALGEEQRAQYELENSVKQSETIQL